MKVVLQLIWLLLHLTVSKSTFEFRIDNSLLSIMPLGSKVLQKRFSEPETDSKMVASSERHSKKYLMEEQYLKRPGNDDAIQKRNQKLKRIGTFLSKKYQTNPVRRSRKVNLRRQIKKDTSSSSSVEMNDWKQEFDDIWLHKKFEALKYNGTPRGDEVNIIAARPWGTSCGDPNQLDAPLGSCTLAVECEAEYRIYRGDEACGRTRFVCCAIALTVYDMYQGFDISMAPDTEASTDSEERNRGKLSDKQIEIRKRKRDKVRRKRKRKLRANEMARLIRTIIKRLRKILFIQTKASGQDRRKKTEELKKLLRKMKKQFKDDRLKVLLVHEKEMVRIDEDVRQELNHLLEMNNKYVSNYTFRELIKDGMSNRDAARVLLDTYPEIESMIPSRRGMLRRPRLPEHINVEAGYLYYN